MPLLIGLLGLVTLLAGGVVDLSAIYLNQRALYQVADSSALAAVTQLDQERYYEEGAAISVPTQNAYALVSRVIQRSQLPRSRIEQIEGSDGVVSVQLAHDFSLPWPFLVQTVTVRARAKAEALGK